MIDHTDAQIEEIQRLTNKILIYAGGLQQDTQASDPSMLLALIYATIIREVSRGLTDREGLVQIVRGCFDQILAKAASLASTGR